VRFNRDGAGVLPFFGHITALAEDPIEKKPLYHYRPGTGILSLGFTGCNLRCPFCQNWHISQQTGGSGKKYSPPEILNLARAAGFDQIAYTYSEPLVHIEFLLECMALARQGGIRNVLVSNGSVNGEAAGEVLSLTDAANIDLKSFSPDTYARLLGGNLQAVLGFIRAAREKKVHLEVTTLVVPGLNDGEGEIGEIADFLAALDRDIPWHLSAYHPAYRWQAPATAPELLEALARRGREKLAFVYTGNTGGRNDTLCPQCGAPLVRRRAYRVDPGGLTRTPPDGGYRCARCGSPAPFIRP
jgi:pyruvate formate lyase activating enzyme